MASMGWLKRSAARLKRGTRGGGSGQVDDGITMHLTEFARTRRGVEAFVEPKTVVTQTTLLLVAFDGEWTRRVVPIPEWGHKFAESPADPGLRRRRRRLSAADARLQHPQQEAPRPALNFLLRDQSALRSASNDPRMARRRDHT